MKAYPTTHSVSAKINPPHSLQKILLLTLMVVLLGVGEVCAQTTTWVSKDSDGNEGNGQNYLPSISADGRYVAFMSTSSDLVPEDTNGVEDIFVHDSKLGETTRVSVNSNGNEGNGWSSFSSISANGRYVAFFSAADNLVPDDNNWWIHDIFVHDRETGVTTRVSIDSDGSGGNEYSVYPSISPDGSYVSFLSAADNLVPNDTNGWQDIFVHDRGTGETTRVSIDSDGNQANYPSEFSSISTDGQYVAFDSYANNLVPDDTNNVYDIFVHDRGSGETTRVSVDSDGHQANSGSYWPSISGDGRYVAFRSYASNLVPDDTNGWDDIFVHDRETGKTTRVSVDSDGNEANYTNCFYSSISANGRYVAFDSYASTLVPDDTNGMSDIFVHDLEMGETIRVSVDSDGNQADGHSLAPSIESYGHVAFQSSANNLVTEDTSNMWGDEIFVHGPLTEEPLDVNIDIAPKRDPNRINPEHGRLAVAVLTQETFDATQVDSETVRFGPDEAEAIRDRIVDIDRDGDEDLLLYFQIEDTGIACGDTEATLSGETFEGVPVSGTNSIVTIGCR